MEKGKRTNRNEMALAYGSENKYTDLFHGTIARAQVGQSSEDWGKVDSVLPKNTKSPSPNPLFLDHKLNKMYKPLSNAGLKICSTFLLEKSWLVRDLLLW
jgi:hypothetical protein